MISKLLSARFILAVIFGVTCCAGYLLGMFPGEAFGVIVVIIVKEYFGRHRPEENNKGGSTA